MAKNKIERIDPVSYTHLDVYKRQAYISQMWAEAMEIYRSGMFKLSFSPAMQRSVSYTHLDVYKRQQHR